MTFNRRNDRDDIGTARIIGAQDSMSARSVERVRVPQLAPTVYRPASSAPRMSSHTC